MKKLVFIFLGAMLSTAAAFAGDMKVGVVNLPEIVQQSSQIKAINKSLDDQFKPEQEKIIKAQNELRDQAKKLAPGAASKLTDDQRKDLQKKISDDQKNFQELVVKYQESVNKAQADAMQKFLGEINVAVSKIAKDQNLDVVLLKQAVVYAGNEVDITDKVVSQLPKN